MNKIISLYTTTSGRIGRKDWWIGAIIIGVLTVVVNMVLQNIVGGSINLTDPNADLNAIIDNAIKMSGWASLISALIFAYPTYALGVKRRHDRNNNGLDVLVLPVLQIVMALLTALGIGYSGGERTVLLSAVFIATAALGLYLLVMLGVLKGDAGPNQYGADPVA